MYYSLATDQGKLDFTRLLLRLNMLWLDFVFLFWVFYGANL
jgi:hypothetical protein